MDRHVEGGSPAETLVSLVRDRAAQTPDRMAFAFLVDGEGDQVELSCADLEREARRVASLIGERVAPGGRAVLVFEPGLDFLGAFFGCLFAGVTAVPVYPPFPQQLEAGLARLGGVLEDSEAGAVLASRALIGLADLMANGGGAPWIESDAGDGDPDGWRDPGVRPSTVAIMQYTSGSTSEPRGVVLHHEHVIANLRSIDWFLGGAAHGPSVSWLPTYHDMGLIGGVIYNLSRGRPTHLLSPLHFLKRPGRWLELVSGVRATVTGGPNFAYELAVRRSTEEERAGLDLSCLDICFIGAEPLRAETVRRFEEAFAGSGLRAGTVLGCYGLAEASLLVAGAQRGPSRTATLDAGEFGRGRAVPTGAGMGRTVEAVSSGGTPPGHDVRIVDPVAAEEVPTGRIGEIWFHGPSVAEGYWHRPELTEATFGARLHPEDDPTRRYLRTGDLGFLLGDQLFVTGRLKDLIVVRGRNVQPHDVELAVQNADPRHRAGRGVAFPVETDLGEGIGLVQETAEEDPAELDSLARLARHAVTEAVEVSLAALWLVPPRTILTTANGKLRRGATRMALEAGELTIVHESRRGTVQTEALPSGAAT